MILKKMCREGNVKKTFSNLNPGTKIDFNISSKLVAKLAQNIVYQTRNISRNIQKYIQSGNLKIWKLRQ